MEVQEKVGCFSDTEEESYESTDSEKSDDTFQPALGIKIMCAYMYFIQGVISSIPGTIVYVYAQLPDYLILSVFSFSNVPYSYKFVVAPLLEKYFHVQYGKRKTWIMISQTCTCILLICSSFFTQDYQSLVMGWFTVGLNTAMSLQDIALDGLSIKEMKSRSRMSTYQNVFQSTGIVLGSLGLLKLTSIDFAKSIGLNAPISNLRVVLIGIAIMLLIPSLLIHFLYEETYIHEETIPRRTSVWRVYGAYRCYFYPSFRYFRQGLYLLFYYQGVNFFISGYNYELINHGFSRDTMNDIDNINLIPLTLLAFFLGMYSNYLGFTKSIMTIQFLFLINFLYMYIFFPTTTIPIAITSFTVGFIANWQFIESSIVAANFPPSAMTSMLYTFGASCNNAGKLNFIQTALLKIYPWRVWAVVGMVYICVIIAITPWAMKFIHEGETDISEFLTNQDDQQSSQFQAQEQST